MLLRVLLFLDETWPLRTKAAPVQHYLAPANLMVSVYVLACTCRSFSLKRTYTFFKLLLSPSFLTYLAMLDASFDFSLGGSNSQWVHQHYDQQNEMQSHLLKKTHY